MPRFANDQSPVPERLDWIAILKMRAEDLEKTHNLCLMRYQQDGLGDAIGGFIELKSKRRIVVEELQQVRHPCLVIYAPLSELHEEVLTETLDDFGLSEDDCLWIYSDGLEGVTGEFELYRTDDHGNRFHIETFPTRAEAQFAKDRFESAVHKQSYWIERKSP